MQPCGGARKQEVMDELEAALSVDHIGVDLWQVTRAYEAAMFSAIAQAGFDDLSLADSLVLSLIGPNGARATEIARGRAISKQAMQEQTARLISKGYLRSEPDPKDRRAKRLFLSPKGEAMGKAFVEIKIKLDAHVRSVLGAPRHATLRNDLARIRRALEIRP